MSIQGITYKLAKELKDAGFPVALIMGGDEWKGEKVYFDGTMTDKGHKIGFLSPTLPELIEACSRIPNTMITMSESGDGWYVGKYNFYDHEWVERIEGETLDIALAKLWINLNRGKATLARG